MVEMLFVLITIGAVTTIATPRLSGMIGKANVAEAIGEINAINADIVDYLSQHDSLPQSLDAIGWTGYRDPWDQPYIYRNFGDEIPGDARVDQFGVPINTTFDLYSLGEDGSSSPSIMTGVSQDDVLLGEDGGFIGSAIEY